MKRECASRHVVERVGVRGGASGDPGGRVERARVVDLARRRQGGGERSRVRIGGVLEDEERASSGRDDAGRVRELARGGGAV